MKKLKWSLATMLTAWIELGSVVMFAYIVTSYVDVLARHSNCASWNLFKVMLELHNSL